MIDKSVDLLLEIARQIVMLEKQAIFQRLMPALNLALGLRMTRRAANIIDAFSTQPSCQVFGHIARAIVGEQTRPWADIRLFQL